ncbi:polygalacturonase, partial [Panicum miliaceum]
TGDDCVSVGPGTANLRVEHVRCGPGHGISIGSLVGKASQEAGTANGLRIKTWARAAAEGAFVRGVVFEHARMLACASSSTRTTYCPNHGPWMPPSSGFACMRSAVKISDVRYADIRGSSASRVAVRFDCSASNPCSGIGLQDIRLAHPGRRRAGGGDLPARRRQGFRPRRASQLLVTRYIQIV